ncbi:MAG: endo-1,4-beta-xylanase [Phycisphaeraceae bacterium]
MLKFSVFDKGQPARMFVLRNAHLLGADNIGVRGTIGFDGGLIVCEKRAGGPAALALQFDAGDVGCVTLGTCLLPERDEPYLLSLELARHRLMMMLAKQEEWMMFDLSADHPAMRRIASARSLFVKALNLQDDQAAADKVARDCLSAAMDASEELALAHAETLLNRRRNAGQFHKGIFGCGIALGYNSDKARASLAANFDFVSLPVRWKQIEPLEQQYDWSMLDSWGEWAYRTRMPILAGPVISFEEHCSPDWLGVLEHDYDTIRDILYEHVERLVGRYRNAVTLWNVVSGIHTNSQLNLTLDQLMDLTRMAVMLTKKIQPTARVLVEITHPWGEYYSVNSRSIPPLIYADMVLQAGIPIDAFGVKVLMGRAKDGQYTRDLMQISAMLDKFSGMGKPLHVTGVAVPSGAIALETGGGAEEPDGIAGMSGMMTGGVGGFGSGGGSGSGGGGGPTTPGDGDSGYWRKPWSPLVQSHWLEAFYNIALSKPFVDSVTWLDLLDHDQSELPHGALATSTMKAKGAFHRIVGIRRNIHAGNTPANARPVGFSAGTNSNA